MPEARLSNSLVLNRFILNLFGTSSLDALGEYLKDPRLEEYDKNNISLFYYEIRDHLFVNSELTAELLLEYDQNIYCYTEAINKKRSEPIRWKYFQYLSLLFTEIYLDRYFTNKEKLLKDINDYKAQKFDEDPQTYHALSAFELGDLNKLAYWCATGSGKTLMMHVNVLQFRHYAEKHNIAINRSLLITPNEGLTRQHLDEFEKSGIAAHVFNKQFATGLFGKQDIDVLEITKLAETDGDTTVAVDFFESKNLVFVDEGHRGNGGDTWKHNRDQLSADGFCFEYSATFGQAIKKDKNLLEEYAKATLFDYSYRYFYNDGYGKDYQILNIDSTENEYILTKYLTACLLNFYEQMKLYKDKGAALKPFLIEKPLAVFVGGSVNADKSIGKQEVSDIVFILKFFQQFISRSDESIKNIDLIINGEDGLVDKANRPIFTRSFKYIRSQQGITAEYVYKDMLSLIFNSRVAGAQLHLDNLKGKEGEIGLRIGNAEYFGIINVGDSNELANRCSEEGISTMPKEFTEHSLFATINQAGSSLNVLIGSKKFTEGWSSWRVSTMGLLNVGKSEGSQIIQLFGRGVRLKGYMHSLKRTSKLDESFAPPAVPSFIQNLETLHIFGIKANYMDMFKKFLEEEGLPTNNSDFEEIDIPILPIVDLKSKKLKYLRVQEGKDFKKEVVVTIVPDMLPYTPVALDYYPKIQAMRSQRNALDEVEGARNEGKLSEEHLAFMDWNQVYFALIDFKNERSWYNLNISLDAIKLIAYKTDWYKLYIPQPDLEFTDFTRCVTLWQEILIALLKGYVEKAYNNAKSKWMSNNVEVAYLDTSHPNFEKEYKIAIHRDLNDICARIGELKELLQNGNFSETIRLAPAPAGEGVEALYIAGHLYQPLIYFNERNYAHAQIGKLIEVKPVQLNRGERDFVCDIQLFCNNNPEFFVDKKLYLLRNKSKQGIGFFDASGFYPDFILWLVEGSRQYVTFVDPKGIRNINGFNNPKIALHRVIREEIEPKLKDPDITLNSFIISNTPFVAVSHWLDFNPGELDGEQRMKVFNEHNVLFQNEQKDCYVKMMIEAMLNQSSHKDSSGPEIRPAIF